jgi:hypothetical protein
MVRTANGFVVSVNYWDNEPKREFNPRKEEAQRVAVGISRPLESWARMINETHLRSPLYQPSITVNFRSPTTPRMEV